MGTVGGWGGGWWRGEEEACRILPFGVCSHPPTSSGLGTGRHT